MLEAIGRGSGRAEGCSCKNPGFRGCSIMLLPGAFMEPEGYRVNAGLHKSDPACEGKRTRHDIGYAEAYGQVKAQVGESLRKVAGHGQFLSQCGIEQARQRRPTIASDFIDRLLYVQAKRRPANRREEDAVMKLSRMARRRAGGPCDERARMPAVTDASSCETIRFPERTISPSFGASRRSTLPGDGEAKAPVGRMMGGSSLGWFRERYGARSDRWGLGEVPAQAGLTTGRACGPG